MTIQQVLLAGGWSPTYATWNSADKDTNCTLSGGNLVADFAVSGLNYSGVRATVGKTAGRWYYEVNIDSASQTTLYIAIANSTQSLTAQPASPNALSVTATSITGNVYGLLLDCDADTIELVSAGVPSGSPVSIAALTGTLFPCIVAQSNNSGIPGTLSCTANFGPNFSFPQVGYSGFYTP